MPENSMDPEPLCVFPGDEINGYTISEKIDEGNFGQVFKVTKNKQKMAMKIEPNRVDGCQESITIEAEILVALQTRKGKFFPAFFDSGKTPKYHFLVMELLNENLKKLREKCPDPNACTPGTWSRIGIQLLYVLKVFHDNGYVHRDLKPANFAMGPLSSLTSRVLYLLDFGISRKLVKEKDGIAVNAVKWDQKNLEMRLARAFTKDFKGTPLYASPNAHSFMDLGRNDDVWSLMFMISELIQPLPWGLMEDQQLERLKKKTKLKTLFKMDALDPIEETLRTSNFYSFPCYEEVYKLLKGVLDKSGVSWQDPYDWETKTLGSYQQWKTLVTSKNHAFPWENPNVIQFFRYDTWKPLMLPDFKPGKELWTQEKHRERKKKSATGTEEGATVTRTAEGITTEEARTPAMVRKKLVAPKRPKMSRRPKAN